MRRNKNKFMNKDGLLLGEHTINLVIAVLVILVLVGGLYTMYNINRGNQDLEKSETALDIIIDRINFVKDSEELNEISVIIYPVKGWYLKSFNNFKSPEGEKELKKSWVCICDGAGCFGEKICKGFKEEDVFVDSSSTTFIPTGGYMMPAGIDSVSEKTLKFKDAVWEIIIFEEEDKISIRVGENVKNE
mgnify:FL=1